MLTLTRRVGEEIVIDGRIVVRIVAIHGKKAKIGVVASEDISVHRREVYDAIRKEQND